MNLKNLFSSSKPAAAVPAASGQPMCAAGHALDPHWGGVCPYCESINRGRQKTAAATRVDPDATVIGRPAQDSSPPVPPAGRETPTAPPALPPALPPAGRETRVAAPAPAPGGRETRIAPPAPAPGGRETRIAPPPSAPSGRETRIAPPEDRPADRPVADTRPVTAVLVALGGPAAGRLFAIRDGRNTIGRSDVGVARRCDVDVTDDAHLVGEHALILSRSGRHELLDLGGPSGTEVDGEPIGSQVVELLDHGIVRIGATRFEFLRIAGTPTPGDALAPRIAGPITVPARAPIAVPTPAPSAASIEAPGAAPIEAPGAAPIEAPGTLSVEAPRAAPIEAPGTAPIAPSSATAIAPVSAPAATPDVYRREEEDPDRTRIG